MTTPLVYSGLKELGLALGLALAVDDHQGLCALAVDDLQGLTPT